jgi:hypothetical protein
MSVYPTTDRHPIWVRSKWFVKLNGRLNRPTRRQHVVLPCFGNHDEFVVTECHELVKDYEL